MPGGEVTVDLSWITDRSIEDPDSGCWLWSLYRNRDGYGWARRNKVLTTAHRHAWEVANGPIPDDMTVDHRCFTPACVRPDHLRLLTRPQNCANKNPANRGKRLKTHCKWGHDLSDARIKAGGRRDCRKCHRKRESERQRRPTRENA